jgi:FMN hydrolase / 5-amino-6-(5-phospho-D-ribitylamino)uracil phosphatase
MSAPNELTQKVFTQKVSSPRVLFLDLDDTLWPILPVIRRAEQTLQAWFVIHAPNVAEQFPPEKMLQFRDQLIAQDPYYRIDLYKLRREVIRLALKNAGERVELLDQAFHQFWLARNTVEFFPDALAFLKRVSARIPIIAVSNGFADLKTVGIAEFFSGQVSAHIVGHAKPDPAIFNHALQLAGVLPSDAIHLGDHPFEDAQAADQLGMTAIWLNRNGRKWPCPSRQPATATELNEAYELIFN